MRFDTINNPSVSCATSGNSPVRFDDLNSFGGHNHRPKIGGFFVSASGLQLVRRMWGGSRLLGSQVTSSSTRHSVRLFCLTTKKPHTTHLEAQL